MHRPMPRDDASPARPANRRAIIGGIGALALGGVSALAAPGPAHARNAVRDTHTRFGDWDGYYEECWTDTPDSVEMTPAPGGGFSVAWQNSNAFICGEGWATGSRRTVEWTGSLATTEGVTYLGLYGWTSNPLVEYYIVENYQGYRPSGEMRGSLSTDGATYDLFMATRFNASSPEGIRTFNQYWSVIQSPRLSGTITTGNHFDAWAMTGMNLGSFAYYMIFAVEGYQGSGEASLEFA